MIKETLSLIRDYLQFSLGQKCTVKLRPVPEQDEALESDMLVTITLLRIEEETSRKPVNTSVYIDTIDEKGNPKRMAVNKKAPDIDINLDILISARAVDYGTALDHIKKVISAMNSLHNVQKPADMNSDFKALKRLNVSILNQTLEQQFTMWQTLHGKLMPSVAYKVRMLTVPGEVEVGREDIVQTIEYVRRPMADKGKGPGPLPDYIIEESLKDDQEENIQP